MHWSDLEHLIAFIKLEIIHCWFGMGGGGGLKAQNKGESNTSLFSGDQRSGSSITAH